MSVSLVCLTDFEKKAQSLIEKNALDYYRSGAGEQFTLNLNREAFRRIRLRPRCLRDVSSLNTEVSIFGESMKWPVGIAPTAMQRMAHPEGEAANARAAGLAGSVFILSTLSTTSIEELAAKAPDTVKWFQLYIYKDRAITEQLVKKAERSNFKAIVLTVDAPVFGHRRSDVRNNFKLPSHLSLANFQGVQANSVKGAIGTSGLTEYVTTQFDATLTWKDVAWLIKFTKLPVILKGILTAEDAVLAKEYGCAGVIVSNHGARQLDHVPASIEALPEIVHAVGREFPVMLDGGIMEGNDVFKALALGAKMVFIGRPAIWGLACNGQKGVEDVLAVLKKEFEQSLALMGCTNLSEITRAMIVHESYYSKL